jgi:hypothetical protein
LRYFKYYRLFSDNKTRLQDAQRMIAARVSEALPNVEIRRVEVVGCAGGRRVVS